jgi:NADH dehydrogenase
MSSGEPTRPAKVRPQVIVIGGGFGGLWAVRALKRAAVDVILIDRRNHHLFQPLLYQVATAALAAPDIAAPLRQILRRQKNVTVLNDEVRSIDPQARTVETSRERLRYDYLVVASGASHSYFGHDDWQCTGTQDARARATLRRRIRAFERRAETELAARADWLRLRSWRRPTGWVCGKRQIARHIAREFRRIRPERPKCI